VRSGKPFLYVLNGEAPATGDVPAELEKDVVMSAVPRTTCSARERAQRMEDR
jgi:hypothetical protein